MDSGDIQKNMPQAFMMIPEMESTQWDHNWTKCTTSQGYHSRSKGTKLFVNVQCLDKRSKHKTLLFYLVLELKGL